MAELGNVYKTWTQIKTFLLPPKDLELQYHEYEYHYKVFVVEAGVEYFTELWTDTSKVTGIDVSQNNLDLTDFEDNYKSDANNAIEQDVYLESVNIDEGIIGVKDSTESRINPVTNETAQAIVDALGEGSGTNILNELQNLDINVEATGLSQEITTQAILDALGQESGNTVLSKLDALKIAVDNLDFDTTDLENKIQSVRDQLDVLLSTRSSEATLLSVLNTIGEESGKTLLTELATVISSLSSLNTKDFATETTLVLIANYLDTVEAKLQSLIDKDFATEATSTAILNTIGQESGSTVLSKLSDIWNKLVELFNTGIAKVKIWDGEQITDVIYDSDDDLNRLAVTGKFQLQATPADRVIHRTETLKNGSSFDMTVDGSVTPVNFDFVPSQYSWYIKEITFILVDTGRQNPEDFGSITDGLTNGLQLLIKSNGTEYEINNAKSNIELALYYPFNEFVTTSSTGFLSEIGVYRGTMLFDEPIIIDADDGDYIRIKVRDNLSTLDYLSSSFKGWRII